VSSIPSRPLPSAAVRISAASPSTTAMRAASRAACISRAWSAATIAISTTAASRSATNGKQSASSTVACPRSSLAWRLPLSSIDKRVDNRAKHLGQRARLDECGEHSDHKSGNEKYECVLGRRLTGLTVEDEAESIQGHLPCWGRHVAGREPYLNRGPVVCLWRAPQFPKTSG
jgi:hypothetical protein